MWYDISALSISGYHLTLLKFLIEISLIFFEIILLAITGRKLDHKSIKVAYSEFPFVWPLYAEKNSIDTNGVMVLGCHKLPL